MKILSQLFLATLSTGAFTVPLQIVPKEGAPAPSEVVPGYDIIRYYTVSNNTASTRNNNYVKYLPPNVSQVTTNGNYSDTCGATFSLAPNASCTLQLLVSAPVNSSTPGASNQLFVCSPGGMTCSGTSQPLNIPLSPWQPLTVSYEIIYSANAEQHPKDFLQTYKDAGSNPITGAEWTDYTPPEGYTKNTIRYLQFDESISLGGPGNPIGTETYITTSDGYTWATISNVINAMWPYDSSDYTGLAATGTFYAGNLVLTPPAGVVKLTANYKSQLMRYYATENGVPIARYFITDQWGNKYLMQASDYDTPEQVAASFELAALPDGWSKETAFLTEDLVLHPSSGPNNTFEYSLIRDNQNNTYNQIYWSPSGITLASQIQETGMPIWGGLSENTLMITNSFDNLIYGGGGVTTFVFSEDLTTGVNTIADFNPFLGDTLDLDGQDYTSIITKTGVEIFLSGGAKVILDGIFIFSDSWIVN